VSASIATSRTGRISPLTARLAIAFVVVALAAIAALTVVTLLAARGGVSQLTERQQQVTVERAAMLAAAAYEQAGGWEGADLRAAVAVASAEGGRLTVVDGSGTTVELAHAGEMRGVMERLHGGRRGDATDAPLIEPVIVDGREVGAVEVRFPVEGTTLVAGELGNTLTRNVLAAAGMAALLALAAAWFVASRVTRPLARLTNTVEAVAAGDRAARSDAADEPGELGALARSVDRMADTLERQDELRRALVADVAHELRTPLAIALGECDAMVDGVSDPDPERFASIREEIVRLARLVEDLEALAAAESAGLQLDLEPVDLAEVVRDLLALHGPRLADAGLYLDADLHDAPVVGDPLRLGQIVTNLLTNATKFTPPGGRIEVGVTDGDPVTLRVTDDGPGIPEEDLPHVFQRFWRGTSVPGTSGSGVGLAVVAELTRAHGGHVEASNAAGSGARFTVYLPRH
jgi:two-component system, OmpR family, sensor histidine kinase BaeS